MLALLLTCLLLVILPIIYDQYHRCSPYTSSTSSKRTSFSISPHTAPTRGNPTSSNLDGVDDQVPDSPPTRRALPEAWEGGLSRYSTSVERKPWDPPFPRAPTIPHKQENEVGNEKPSLAYLGPSRSHTRSERHERATLPPPPQSIASTSSHPPAPSDFQNASWKSALRLVVFALAVVLFVFAFAVLIAHCLAWFIVYKTEARLGELHKGVLRGGDMRVCLCAP